MGRDHSCEVCGTGGFNSPHDPNCDGMTDDQAADAYMAALAELDRNPWRERAEGLEAALRWLYGDPERLTDESRWPALLHDVLKGEQAK